MAKENIGFNQPSKALNRDQNNLGESDYSTLYNGLFDGTDGGTFTLTNEMSNLLASRFKEGFKVINATNDIYSNNTYFFITNPATGVGEFGVIKNVQQVVNIEDTVSNCTGCVEHLDLATPLEGQTQTELNQYQTLLTDACHIASGNPKKGFMFDINHPIKKTVIKNEKCGKVIYFTDNKNKPRYIILDNLLQYQLIGDIVCGQDNRVSTCLDAEKLLIFKNYNSPRLSPTSIQLGGRLKLGVYEFLVAYCDSFGSERSEYTSITNPIQIFDRNNVTLLPSELSAPTNFCIKLEVKDLDQRFTHYKIAVIENTLDSVGATKYFVEGLHTINDNIVVYGGKTDTRFEIGISDLLKENIFVEKWELLTEAYNSLIGVGITTEKEINLQPIVNLLELKWQTHIAQEDLYKDGTNVSKYLSYQRDEVVPFSIRFLLDGGYKTALFPLISRNPITTDTQEVNINNADRKSIESNKGTCVTSDRTEHWQYYNTSTEDGGFCVIDDGTALETISIDEDVEKICTISNIYTIPAGTYTFDLEEEFTDLKTYIEKNSINCAPTLLINCQNGNLNTYPFCNYMSPICYEDINCTPVFNEERVYTLTLGNEYIIYEIKAGDNFTGTGFVSSGIPFTAVGQPPVWTNITEVFNNSCTTPTKSADDVIVVNRVEGEEVNKIEAIFPSEYIDTILKNKCRIYKNGNDSGVEFDLRARKETVLVNPDGSYADDTFYTSMLPCGSYAAIRDFEFTNTNYNAPEDAQQIVLGYLGAIRNYFNNYYLSDTENSLISARPAVSFNTNWKSFLHVGALWFKATSIKNKFIFEITPQNLTEVKDTISIGTSVRISFYKSNKGALPPFYSQIVDLSQGQKYILEKINNIFSITDEAGITTNTTLPIAKFYVAVDCPLTSQLSSTVYTRATAGSGASRSDCNNTLTTTYRIAPTDGCYGIVIRDVEYTKVNVSFTSIVLDKKQTYSSICTFQKPILNSCKANPYKKGTFAYWRSEETYPDNGDLYNSSTLSVKPSDIPMQTRQAFEDNFVIKSGNNPILLNGNYQWRLDSLGKPLSNYTCRGIQHFRMPDNKVSPFMYESQQLSQSNSVIYPLGVTIDENTINAYLNLAVSNHLITQEKRDLITGYEIFRGNIDQDRSIQASGLLFNMRTYEQDGQTFQYSNYPYNDLGIDKLNLDSKDISYNKFTFHSPETDYGRPTLPSEMSIQGYVFGQTTNNYFDEVKEHPKYVVLTDSARKVARNLALLETAAEIAVTIAQSAETYRFDGGFVFSVNPVGIGMNILSGLLSTASSVIVNYGRYRLQWLKTFRDLGEPQNFAYYNHSSAKYNYLKTIQTQENQLRGLNQVKYLKPKDTVLVNDVTGKKLNINNLDREKSVFLSLGEDHSILYPTEYSNFDNNITDYNTGSLGTAKEINACVKGKSRVINKNVASPYTYLKNYLPSQHGKINSITWQSTGYRGNLKLPHSSCTPIFGGDTFIARHTVKRKIPLFHTDNFGGADLAPFAYKQYCNIGRNPQFYIDYEVGDGIDSGQGSIIPDINYNFNFDCENRDGNYYKSPSKFYLYYYGVPNFLTETRINTWNRTAEKELKNNFFPNSGDTSEITQEKNVSIKEEEKFFYNPIYSKGVTSISRRTLYDAFNQLESDCRSDMPNGLMWSNADNSENNYNDPYLIFNSSNVYEAASKYGKVKDVRTIEREQILIRQEHATSLFNALDLAVDDGRKPETKNLATSFARRPLTYTESDLGYGGSSSTQSVSCEFGHFHVDAKRGQVIQVKTGGQGAEDIASTINGQPSGMRNWFKEHLPFKILKSGIVNADQIDLDNAINGVGISMGYDARFRRVFITKKDYILKPDVAIRYENFKYFKTDNTEVKLTNETYFKDVSFTIAFSALESKWIGWYSYKPNYYIPHQNYFQTGINNTNDSTEFGVWSHLLTNRSYGVFYGKSNPFIVEYMLKRNYNISLLKAVGFDMNVYRYHNEYDAAEINDKTFNKVYIYSPLTHSGQLNLVINTGLLSMISQYPVTSADSTQQDILVTKSHNEFTFNYFYNRLLTTKSNKPTNLWDENQIAKTVNNEIVKFGGKNILEPMRSNVFTVRLQQDNDSRLRYNINLLTSKLNLEQ